MAVIKSRAPVISLLVVLASFLLASTNADGYIFNGYRGSFTPNNDNNNNNKQNGRTVTSSNNVNTYNNNNNNDAVTNALEKDDNDNSNYNNQPCVQKSFRDFRSAPGSCSMFYMCSGGVLIPFKCPANTVFSNDAKSCVPKGSRFDSCEESNRPSGFTPPEIRPQPLVSQKTTLCPRGVSYKKAHPVHCARYYDCGKPAMMDRWQDHEWECKYPFLFNDVTKRCEHYSMVNCGTRKIAYDRCEYQAYSCNGHSHCRPCTVSYPSCRSKPDGMNVWEGRVPSPYYVVCAANRVVYSGSCPSGQLFNGKSGTCVIMQQGNRIW